MRGLFRSGRAVSQPKPFRILLCAALYLEFSEGAVVLEIVHPVIVFDHLCFLFRVKSVSAARLDGDSLARLKYELIPLIRVQVDQIGPESTCDKIEMLRLLLMIMPTPEELRARVQRPIREVPKASAILKQRELSSFLHQPSPGDSLFSNRQSDYADFSGHAVPTVRRVAYKSAAPFLARCFSSSSIVVASGL
jgi:hypothetical protein